MTYHSKTETSIEFINKNHYICNKFGHAILDHKGNKIFVPIEYRKYYTFYE